MLGNQEQNRSNGMLLKVCGGYLQVKFHHSPVSDIAPFDTKPILIYAQAANSFDT